jgi:hypothetical protein
MENKIHFSIQSVEPSNHETTKNIILKDLNNWQLGHAASPKVQVINIILPNRMENTR